MDGTEAKEVIRQYTFAVTFVLGILAILLSFFALVPAARSQTASDLFSMEDIDSIDVGLSGTIEEVHAQLKSNWSSIDTVFDRVANPEGDSITVLRALRFNGFQNHGRYGMLLVCFYNNLYFRSYWFDPLDILKRFFVPGKTNTDVEGVEL